MYCGGPHRTGAAPSSPKLVDFWPKEGPPLLWKSEWLPRGTESGWGSPVVAEGRVLQQLNQKRPIEGGDEFHLITKELLTDWGWMEDMPESLAKKIEDAWQSPKRPSSRGWKWWEIEWSKNAYCPWVRYYVKKGDPIPQDPSKDLEEFLAKKPELAKYIKDGTIS